MKLLAARRDNLYRRITHIDYRLREAVDRRTSFSVRRPLIQGWTGDFTVGAFPIAHLSTFVSTIFKDPT